MTVTSERIDTDRLRQWVPREAVIDIVARIDRSARPSWSAEIPAFRIAEHGQSREEAVERAREQLLLYLSEAAEQGRSFGEAEAARKPMLQMIGLVFLVVLVLKTSRDKDATWWRLPADRLVSENWDVEQETLEILHDDETMTPLRESDDDFEAGRVRPYEDVRRDLGLG